MGWLYNLALSAGTINIFEPQHAKKVLNEAEVSPEPLLFAHARYMPRRSLRETAKDYCPTNGWPHAFECSE